MTLATYAYVAIRSRLGPRSLRGFAAYRAGVKASTVVLGSGVCLRINERQSFGGIGDWCFRQASTNTKCGMLVSRFSGKRRPAASAKAASWSERPRPVVLKSGVNSAGIAIPFNTDPSNIWLSQPFGGAQLINTMGSKDPNLLPSSSRPKESCRK